MRTVYRATPCPCGDPICTDWHVEPVAALQGVKFTQGQAEAVADLLNERTDLPGKYEENPHDK